MFHKRGNFNRHMATHYDEKRPFRASPAEYRVAQVMVLHSPPPPRAIWFHFSLFAPDGALRVNSYTKRNCRCYKCICYALWLALQVVVEQTPTNDPCPMAISPQFYFAAFVGIVRLIQIIFANQGARLGPGGCAPAECERRAA
jgi:hypothetical protein